MMTDRPIIFSSCMINALIAGRKTQTRRILKDAPTGEWFCDPTPTGLRWVAVGGAPSMPCVLRFAVGDRFWVCETFAIEDTTEYDEIADIPEDGRPIRSFNDEEWGRWREIPHYRATEPEPNIVPDDLPDPDDDRTRWSSPIRMPRWASRLTLTIAAVKVERLQDISDEDARAEGWPGRELLPYLCSHPRLWYQGLWSSLHGSASWQSNPWVAAISFMVEPRNIDALSKTTNREVA